MHNNILRTEKVKSRSQITQAAEHNFRLRDQNNIDPDRTPLNKIMVNSLGVDVTKASDLQEKLTVFYQGLGIKERSDNVLMMEFVVSASPEFFEKKLLRKLKPGQNIKLISFRKNFQVRSRLLFYILMRKRLICIS